jgi:hypothetical protein
MLLFEYKSYYQNCYIQLLHQSNGQGQPSRLLRSNPRELEGCLLQL